MLTSLKSLAAVFTKSGRRWVAHSSAQSGAALAYYSVFSMGPLLLIIVSVAGLVLGSAAAQGELVGQLRSLVGDTAAHALEAMLASASHFGTGLIAVAVGGVTLLIAATGVVIQLKSALNVIWEAQSPAGELWWSILRRYLVALLGILGAGFLLMASLVVTTAIAGQAGRLVSSWPVPLMTGINLVLSLAVATVLFAAMFKWLPDCSVAWQDVWVGALLTGVLFEAGKAAIGWYVGRRSFESTYGAAASVVVLMVWIYYVSQIVLFGAEFTRVWAERLGSRRAMASPRRQPAQAAQ